MKRHKIPIAIKMEHWVSVLNCLCKVFKMWVFLKTMQKIFIQHACVLIVSFYFLYTHYLIPQNHINSFRSLSMHSYNIITIVQLSNNLHKFVIYTEKSTH